MGRVVSGHIIVRKNVNKPFKLSEFEKEVLYGVLLGDGCLCKNKGGKNYQFAYTSKSKQHVEFVRDLLKNILIDKEIKYHSYLDKRTNKTYSQYRIRSEHNSALTELQKEWYGGEKENT